MSDALGYMEAIDVRNNEYRMYLPTGGRFDCSSAIALMRRVGHLEEGDEDLEAAVWRTARERQ